MVTEYPQFHLVILKTFNHIMQVVQADMYHLFPRTQVHKYQAVAELAGAMVKAEKLAR